MDREKEKIKDSKEKENKLCILAMTEKLVEGF